ncbi:uncharacterized protein VTP21DRAFT_1457 [Calcarisporiella thermophila]|uniref:uncharacterized protein n=1 Tax=Calcarisporiella thermophila TaxID=911321 RepID=UPI003744806E
MRSFHSEEQCPLPPPRDSTIAAGPKPRTTARHKRKRRNEKGRADTTKASLPMQREKEQGGACSEASASLQHVGLRRAGPGRRLGPPTYPKEGGRLSSAKKLRLVTCDVTLRLRLRDVTMTGNSIQATGDLCNGRKPPKSIKEVGFESYDVSGHCSSAVP